MKTCSKCNIKKAIIDFYKDLSREDNLEPSCKTCKLVNKKKSYIINRNKIIDYNSERYHNNSNNILTKRKPYAKEWRNKNSETCRFYCANYRAMKLNATPKWLTKEDLGKIKQLYKECKKMEQIDKIERHVDHIVPLQGETVCGLHVPWNLQILTKTENLKKSNNLLED